MSLFLFHFQFAQLIVPYPKSVALEDTSRMPCEVNSNADSEFDLRAGGFYTRLVFTLTNKPISFPVQGFDAIPASSAEQEKCIGKRIQREFLLNHGCQTVDTTAKICVAAGNVHPIRTSEVGQHDFSTRSTASTVAASAPL